MSCRRRKRRPRESNRRPALLATASRLRRQGGSPQIHGDRALVPSLNTGALTQEKPARKMGAMNPEEKPLLADWAELEQSLGVTFDDKGLLQQAFVHRSYLHENPDAPLASNERLEFLGDSLIGLSVAEYLYREYPDLPEGDLTKLRSILVRRDTLARVGSALNLGDYLYLGRGEASTGGRQRPANLGRVFEALVGAIVIDQGYAVADAFVLKELNDEFRRLREQRPLDDPKSELQEVVQARGYGPPAYRLLRQEGPDHAKEFTIEVTVGERRLAIGTGPSKQSAEKDAARIALQLLRSIDPAARISML